MFIVHSSPFTVRSPFTFNNGKPKTEHGKRMENRKRNMENGFTGGKA
jgi:hypothetical protein